MSYVLHDGQHENHDWHLKHKTENCPDTIHYTIHHYGVQAARLAYTIQETALRTMYDITKSVVLAPVERTSAHPPSAIDDPITRGYVVHLVPANIEEARTGSG